MPLLVESVKDGIEDSLDAVNVSEEDDGSGATANFDEATLDGVGGAQLAPERLGEIEEGKQFGQIALQTPDQAGIKSSANESGSARRRGGPGWSGGEIDALGIAFDRGVIAAAHGVAEVAHLCTQQRWWRARIDGLDAAAKRAQRSESTICRWLPANPRSCRLHKKLSQAA